MKIAAATPAYDGKLCVETAISLLNEQVLALCGGDELQFICRPGSSSICSGRNILADDFLKSDCDRLVFIDSDVSWEPGALVKIAKAPVDFAGGAYRYKSDPERYPVSWTAAPELWSDPDTGLIEVAGLPGGFMSLSRNVLERLRAAHPEREFIHPYTDAPYFAFFYEPPGSSDDASICNDWRALGEKIWLDPTLTLSHTGGNPTFSGCIGSWLKARVPA